jgi:hypothetical protein
MELLPQWMQIMLPEAKPPSQGGLYSTGRLETRASVRFKSPFSSCPEKWGKKGDLKPHGDRPHVAPPNATSLRTFRLLGRHASGRNRRKNCDTKSMCGALPSTYGVHGSLVSIEEGHLRRRRFELVTTTDHSPSASVQASRYVHTII